MKNTVNRKTEFRFDREAKQEKNIKNENIESVCLEECREIKNELSQKELENIELVKHNREKYNREMKAKIDTGYYFTVIFQTRGQAEKFLTETGIGKNEIYVDGLELSEKLGIKIKPEQIKFKYARSKKWLDLD